MALPAAVAAVGICGLYVPYYAIGPGPAEEVLRLVSVPGAQAHPKVKLYLTTVTLRQVRLAEVVVGWLDPATDVVPREAVIPPGMGQEDVDRANAEEMEASKRDAAAAALSYLRYPVRFRGARVEGVVKGMPADGVLRPGDLIVAVDGQAVEDQQAVGERIRARRPGDPVRLRFVRDGTEQEVTLRTVLSRDEPPRAVVGVTLSLGVELPLDVRIRSLGIGGPSAGLMFALGIVELLRPAEAPEGLVVAGTGTITADGRVGEVGGVAQKVVAAERVGAHLFIVPAGEIREARRAARRMRVVGVRDLGEAVAALQHAGAAFRASGGRRGQPAGSPK